MENKQEHKFGICSWCGKHNTMLTSVVGQHNGRIMAQWICSDCLRVAQRKTWGDALYDKIWGSK